MRRAAFSPGGPPLVVVAGVFFLSGISGLMYQVLWLRLLSVVFGVTTYAASTVLASFMCGLALGSVLAGRLADRTRHPLRWFGGVELGIGLSALLTPWLLDAAHTLYSAIATALPDNGAALTLARFVCSSMVLLVPTALMGATLPLVARSSIVRQGHLGPRLGLLYAVNAGGAITGAILAGFYLIGHVGLRRTFLFAAALNAVVALSAFVLSATTARRADAEPPQPERDAPRRPDEPADTASPAYEAVAPVGGTAAVLLIVFACSGLASLALEVIWFRMLVLLLPATTYAFTTMLATVLGGITAGSLIAAALLRRERDWLRLLALINLGTGIAVLGSLFLLTSTYQLGWKTSAPIQASVTAIFPSALLMGLAFPVALRLWSGGGDPTSIGVGRRVGIAYAVNMVGAIAGALLGGFVLLPQLGSRLSLVAAASVFVLSGVLVASRARRPRQLIAPAMAALVGFAWLASLQHDLFEVTIGRRYARGETVLWREEGVQTTVAVNREPGGTRVMYLDGLHQANDSFSMVQVHSQIGHFPMALHPAPRKVLVIGLGGGATAGAVSRHGGATVDVVELSASVVRGAAHFAHVNHDVLRQPHVRIRVSDGRNHLALTREKYDVITADIIQPRHAGAGLVYSREYFTLARNALAERGIMLQWIGHRPKVEYDLIMRTFLEVFPEATLWNGGTLMVGTKEPLTLSRSAFERKLRDAPTAAALAAAGLGSFDALVGAYSADAAAMRAAVGNGPILTDDHPRIEYHRSLGDDTEQFDPSVFKGEGRERIVKP